MKIINKAISVILAATLGVSLTGCKSEKESEKVIRIGSPTADATALVENAGFALSLGYIEEELSKTGYKVELVGFGQGGTAINEALSSNQVDAAFVGDIPSIIAKSSGLDIEVVANLNNASGMGIIVGNSSDISSPEELKGKKIVVAFGTTTYVYLVRLLSEYGMTIDDVELINDIANGGPLVASGDADAVVSTLAGVIGYRDAGVGKILVTTSEDDAVKAVSQFYFYGNKSYIDKNEDAVKAIIRALIRSKEKAETDPDATYKALATADKGAEVWENIYPRESGFDFFEPYITDKDKEYYDSTAKLLLDSNVITKEIHAADFFTNKYTEAVYKELGKDLPQ